MNSRVAYDEDEMLRRAIQESREMGTGTLGKRMREDLDEFVFTGPHTDRPANIDRRSRPAVKRQRTGSGSSGTASKRSVSPATIEEIPGRGTSRGKQNLRGAAAKNNREREMRDIQKEQAATLRAEAANKRNARSERRRVDGNTHIEKPRHDANSCDRISTSDNLLYPHQNTSQRPRPNPKPRHQPLRPYPPSNRRPSPAQHPSAAAV